MLGRFGACLAFASSLLAAAAAPSTASAHNSAQQPGQAHFSIRLTPQEVATGGNPGGSGEARLDLDEAGQTACYFLEWRGLKGEVTAAHLHAGPRGQDGPHVIDFFNNQHFPGQRSTASGCVTSNRDTIRAIINNPSGHYINIHTSEFKPGAIRGQLG